MTDGVTLQGQGWDRTVIRPAAGKQIRCVKVDGGAKLVGVTLTGGKCTDEGAGVKVANGTVSWCCVSNNTATSGGKSGAGVSFTGGCGQIDHSIVADNTIANGCWGAGIGGVTPSGPIVIDTCLVYGNVNPGGSGGGIGFDKPNTSLTVRNCTVTRNSAVYNTSGGLYFNNCSGGAKIALVNDIIAGNATNGSEGNIRIGDSKGVNYDFVDQAASSHCIFGRESERNDIGVADSLFGVPAFVDAAGGNFRLAEGSSAIAAGTSFAEISCDLDGRRRSSLPQPSVGCYEYNSAGFMLLLR